MVGKGRLGKLCNEDEKAFDIFCRGLQAVAIQRRITERGMEKNHEEENERERGRRRRRPEERKRGGLGGGKRSELSPTPHLGGDEPRCLLAVGRAELSHQQHHRITANCR